MVLSSGKLPGGGGHGGDDGSLPEDGGWRWWCGMRNGREKLRTGKFMVVLKLSKVGLQENSAKDCGSSERCAVTCAPVSLAHGRISRPPGLIPRRDLQHKQGPSISHHRHHNPKSLPAGCAQRGSCPIDSRCPRSQRVSPVPKTKKAPQQLLTVRSQLHASCTSCESTWWAEPSPTQPPSTTPMCLGKSVPQGPRSPPY